MLKNEWSLVFLITVKEHSYEKDSQLSEYTNYLPQLCLPCGVDRDKYQKTIFGGFKVIPISILHCKQASNAPRFFNPDFVRENDKHK